MSPFKITSKSIIEISDTVRVFQIILRFFDMKRPIQFVYKTLIDMVRPEELSNFTQKKESYEIFLEDQCHLIAKRGRYVSAAFLCRKT